MPERIKLTEKVLRDAEPVPGRDYQIFDTDVRGFATCIYRGGGRAFTLDYRHAAGGAGRRVALQLGWDSDLDARGLRWRIRLAGATAIILRGDTQVLAEGGTVISAGLLPATAYEVSARLARRHHRQPETRPRRSRLVAAGDGNPRPGRCAPAMGRWRGRCACRVDR